MEDIFLARPLQSRPFQIETGHVIGVGDMVSLPVLNELSKVHWVAFSMVSPNFENISLPFKAAMAATQHNIQALPFHDQMVGN